MSIKIDKEIMEENKKEIRKILADNTAQKIFRLNK